MLTGDEPRLSKPSQTGAEPALATAVTRALSAALANLRDLNLKRLEQGQAIWQVAQVGKSAVPALIELLHDDHPSVRQRAAAALGHIGASRAIDGLLGALADSDPRVRRAAAWALGEIPDERSVPGLLAALDDEHRVVRQRAAWALGQIGDSRALEGLIAVLYDESQHVHMAAAQALGQLRDRRAVPHLLDVITSSSRDVRRLAAEALGTIGDARAVPALIELLNDAHFVYEPGRERNRICDIAARALGHIDTPEARKALHTWQEEHTWPSSV